MNFFKKSSVEEIEDSLQKNIENFYSRDQELESQRLHETIKHLQVAANLLDHVGLEKEAHVITAILASFAEDPMTGLTSDKMVENLKEKGWVFNADDQMVQEVDQFLSEPEEPVAESVDSFTVEEPQEKTASWWKFKK